MRKVITWLRSFSALETTIFALLSTSFLLIYRTRLDPTKFDLSDSSLYGNWLSFNSSLLSPNYFLQSVQVYIRELFATSEQIDLWNFPEISTKTDGVMFFAHSYFILLALKPVASIIGYWNFISIVSAFYVTLPLAYFLIAYRFKLKREEETGSSSNLTSKVHFCFVVVIYLSFPSTLWSPLGQFYPDRMFVIFFPAFALLLEMMWRDFQDKRIFNEKTPLKVLILVLLFLLCLSINERTSFILATYVIIRSAKYWKVCKGYKSAHKMLFASVLAAALSLIWSFYYIEFISRDSYKDSFLSSLSDWQYLKQVVVGMLSLKLAVILLAFLALSGKDHNMRLILVVGSAPHFLGNIGGAEKIGWVTHYMSNLSALLVTSAVLAIMNFKSRKLMETHVQRKNENEDVNQKSRIILRTLLPLMFATVLMISSSIFSNPLSRDLEIGFRANNLGIWGYVARDIFNPEVNNARNQERENVVSFVKRFDPKTVVSVTEDTSNLVALSARQIALFPVDLDNIDLILFFSTLDQNGDIKSPTIVNYASPKGAMKLMEQSTSLLNSPCFRLKKQFQLDGRNLYLLERIKPGISVEKCLSRLG